MFVCKRYFACLPPRDKWTNFPLYWGRQLRSHLPPRLAPLNPTEPCLGPCSDRYSLSAPASPSATLVPHLQSCAGTSKTRVPLSDVAQSLPHSRWPCTR